MDAAVAMARADGDGPLDHTLIHAANEAMGRDGLRVIATGSRILARRRETPHAAADAGRTHVPGHGRYDRPAPGRGGRGHRASAVGPGSGHDDHRRPPGDRYSHRQPARSVFGQTRAHWREMADLDDHMLAARLEQTSVAARVSPVEKLRIVHALQAAGKVVAVTGDGVNDAPALKAAAIGVAMGRSGTDVAREAADVVLTDDNFVTIVHAVEEGRVTFAAIRKTTYFLLSTGAAASVAVTLSVFAGTPLLFLPVQMLWMNVVTNGVQDIALAFEPAEGDELSRPPRPPSEGILSRTLWFRAGITGAWMALAVILSFIVELHNGYPEIHARTLALTMFVMFSFFQVFSSRAENKSLFQLRLLANKPLLYTSLGALGLHWAVMTWPVTAGLLELTPAEPMGMAPLHGRGFHRPDHRRGRKSGPALVTPQRRTGGIVQRPAADLVGQASISASERIRTGRMAGREQPFRRYLSPRRQSTSRLPGRCRGLKPSGVSGRRRVCRRGVRA